MRVTIRLSDEQAEFVSQYSSTSDVIRRALELYMRQIKEIENLKIREQGR